MNKKSTRKRVYLYKQLYEKLRKDILSGVYIPDERLPSMDDLAQQFDMNRITVKRALSELRAEGLIHSIPAQGTYVSPRSHPIPETSGNTKTIALVLYGLHTHALGAYHVDIITGIQETVADLEWYLMLVKLDDPSEDRAYEHLMQIQLDGAIYLGFFPPTLLRRLIKNGPPAVMIDEKIRGVKCDVVNIDNYSGAFEATEHLIELGHRNIACVTGIPTFITQERRDGVLDASKEHGLPPEQIKWIEGDFQRESGNRAAECLLKLKKRPTAVFCFNDEMATGVMQTIHEHGELRIPGDISVMGFDNINWSLATYPLLTTVEVDRFTMGSVAVERLAENLEKPKHTPGTLLVSTKMEIRNSTGPAKH